MDDYFFLSSFLAASERAVAAGDFDLLYVGILDSNYFEAIIVVGAVCITGCSVC